MAYDSHNYFAEGKNKMPAVKTESITTKKKKDSYLKYAGRGK